MSLLKYAKQYIKNQETYGHLNAFVSRVDLSSFADRSEPSQAEKQANKYADKYADQLRYARSDSLHSMPIAVKDNICTKDLKTTAASGILKDFTSPYDATVVKLLQDAGAVVVGKTNMDEFGMGSHSTHSHAGPVKMQRYQGEEASAGGSSGGSALAVASAQCLAALGTDTGGSVRLPAAYTGVVGFKPSYGLLSRWGVIAYANSLDTVGILSKNAAIIEHIFDKLNAYDAQDPTSLPPRTRARLNSDEERPISLRIGIPLDYNIATLQPTVRSAWVRALKALAEEGHSLHPVRLPATQHALSAYYVLAPAEASSNLAKYDGVRFGSRAEGFDGTPNSVLFAKTRGQGFGSEVQRRILLGAFSLSAQAIDNYFIQAQKVRRLVQQDFNNIFAKANPLEDTPTTWAEEGVDVLVCPTAPTLAPSLSEVNHQDPLQAYMNDVFTVPASLAGLPAISVPVHITEEERKAIHGFNDIMDSAGIQIIGQFGDDKLVLRAAKELEKVCDTVQRHASPAMTAWGVSSLGPSTVNQRKHYADLATRLSVTVVEAMEIAEAATGAVSKREEVLRTEALISMMRKAVGTVRLDHAALLCNTTRSGYLAKFIREADPIAAEKAYREKLMEMKGSIEVLRKRARPEGRQGAHPELHRTESEMRNLRRTKMESKGVQLESWLESSEDGEETTPVRRVESGKKGYGARDRRKWETRD